MNLSTAIFAHNAKHAFLQSQRNESTFCMNLL